MKRILATSLALILLGCTPQAKTVSLEGTVAVPAFVDNDNDPSNAPDTSGWVLALTDQTGLQGIATLGDVKAARFNVTVSKQGITPQDYFVTARLAKNNATLLGRMVSLETNAKSVALTPLSSLCAMARLSAKILGDDRINTLSNSQLEARINKKLQSRFEVALGEFLLGIRKTSPLDDPAFIQEFYAQLREELQLQPSE